MKEKEIEEKTRVTQGKRPDRYRVQIIYKRKRYYCNSKNTLAWQILNGIGSEDTQGVYHTRKKALQEFYDECRHKNGLY